jgi:hypothetical protein
MCEIDPGTHKGMHSVLVLETGCDTLEPNIMVNSISMSWQRVCLPLKSYIVDVDDQVVV